MHLDISLYFPSAVKIRVLCLAALSKEPNTPVAKKPRDAKKDSSAFDA